LQTHALFVDAFVYNSRLEHMIQVMGYHPHYLSAFLAMHHTVLQGPHGPLPYDQRHYIAIMVGDI
jgi:sestrin